MGDKPNGTKPSRPTTQIDLLVQASAADILSELRELYPLRTDLDKFAMGLAQEQVNIQPLLDSMNNPEMTHWQLVFHRPSTIDPKATSRGLEVVAPKRIENCRTEEEALKSITAYALLSTPAARAVLAMHGYKLRVSSVKFGKRPKSEPQQQG